ncbi:MAG: ATP-dependent DNA helicase RecG [Holophagales bacterium]|nr:ATP-dependent DNA helicase RecG [Holophagales bacterium]MYG31947.1 ATP-dependent DNA helicase RecG [Holophagales bacterium]MYI79018.1 ATP-dependent DNA helicase RecG [Holophagales bacterium]
MDARDPITTTRGVGPVLGRRLAAAGCRRIVDLLAHLPLRYEDRRTLGRLPGAEEEDGTESAAPGPLTVVARLENVKRVFGRRRFSRVEAVACDGAARVGVVWFNRPYLARQLEEGVPYLLHGPLRRRGGDGPWQLSNPSVERISGEKPFGGGLRPVYGQIGEVPPSRVARLAADAIRDLRDASGPDWIDEWLPREERTKHQLPRLAEALTEVHSPSPEASIEDLNARRSPAHARLAYGEFLLQQLQLAVARRQRRRSGKPHRYRVDGAAWTAATGLLPFRLTGGQERVLGEIADDLARKEPMLRLVQGDVGSGKTVLAALSCLIAARSDLQSALMAPTELLAEQHFASLEGLLGPHMTIALVTSSQRVASDGGAVEERIAAGRIDLVVGTHALIEERTRFARLGLAVIDEQHRFGVVQRQSLARKGLRPDLLVMTATPIPRSLALTVYGDLDVSILDEMPPGRRPIETRVTTGGGMEEAVEEVRRRLESGGRAYVVFPLIDGGEGAVAGLPSLRESGPDWVRALAAPCGVVHGRLRRQERDETMSRFAAGSIQVLLATTVIEVGVDVPEATAMVILGAERFGLAQLHQLRGRIGRGTDPALGEPLCIAIAGQPSSEAERRLDVFAASTDGFRIAEEDMRQRGPGEILGTRQAGLPQFRFGDLARDWALLVAARQDASELLDRLADPGNDALRGQLERRVPGLVAPEAGNPPP